MMECDIILEIGGKSDFKIDRESSEKELDSLQDIVEYLDTLPEHQLKQLIYDLQTSSTRVKNSQKYFLDKQLIGNCSFENLKLRFPQETELLKDIEKPYIITLVDKAYSNGDMLKGRVVVNGVVSYVFRNKFDVQNFAETEYKKHLVEQIITDNDIADEYLSEKYKDKLNVIKGSYKGNLERITKEVDSTPAEQFTIKHLILDYLNNSSDYTKLIKDGDQIIDAGSVLNDFCRELNKQQVINEDSESELARYLRRLHWKREQFGKSELYKGLATYVPEFAQEVSEQQFINLNQEGMEELLQKYFKNDIILSNYHVESVGRSIPQSIRLTKSQVKKIFDKTLAIKNSERKSLGELELSKNYEDNISSLEEAQQFFQGHLNIDIDGELYTLNISQDKDQIVYSYVGKKLTNDDKIKLKRKGKMLKDEFNFGYDTMNIFTPVNEDGVSDGYYKGYYIYNHLNENGENLFIVSGSVISPNLYDPPKFKSLKDAKLAVEGFNRSANISRQTKVELKQMIGSSNGKRYVHLEFSTNPGQTISSIAYPINPKTKLFAQEHNLITTKKSSEIQSFYKSKGIDISALDLPEKIGTFLYAMTENGYSMNAIQNKPLEEADMENIKKIIFDINNAPVKQYLVERSNKNSDGNYTAYIKSLTDSGITINSTGVDVAGNPPTQSLTSTLFNLKDTLENTLFKDTPIKIVITDNDQLTQLQDPDGNRIFPNGTNDVRAFIYNNNLYINQSNANVNDLLHETFHIVLGAIKAQDMNEGTKNYESILNFYDKKVSQMTKNRVNDLYKNLAQIDRVEEGVVRYLARQVENGDVFYYNDKTDQALELFRQQFLNIKQNIRKNIKLDLDSDLGFQSSVNALVSSQIGQMQKNRIISNLIEKGIEKGLILENCK